MSVKGSFGGNTESEVFEPGGGGVVSATLQRKAGTLTVALHVCIDGGTTFAVYHGNDGVARSITLDANTPTGHLVTDPLQPESGMKFKLVSSSGSTPTVAYSLGRAIWV